MNNQPKLTSRDKTLCKSRGELIINPIADYNILKHKYIKIYLQLICSTLKYVKTKQSNTKLTATKRRNRYKVGYSSESFFTQNCDVQPPRLRQQNYKTKTKPDSQTHSRQPKCATKTTPQYPKTYVRQKGRLRPKPLFKVFFPHQKNIYFLKTKHLFIT